MKWCCISDIKLTFTSPYSHIKGGKCADGKSLFKNPVGEQRRENKMILINYQEALNGKKEVAGEEEEDGGECFIVF